MTATSIDPTPSVVDRTFDHDTGIITTHLSNGDWFTDEDDPDDPDDGDYSAYFAEMLPDPTPLAPPPAPRLDKAVAQYVTQHRLLTTQMLLDMPEPEWFIEGLVPKSGRLIIHGDPGSRKTFLALDLAVCAEHNLNWHGRKLAPGKVFYILGEGVTGLGKRLRALAAGKGMAPEDIKVTWMAQPLNIWKATPEQVDLWARFVRYFGFKYVVIDTLHMNTAGMGENDSQDMGHALENADKIRGDADLIVIHHNNKSGGMRGSSSLEGDFDTVLEVKESGPLASTLKSNKVRDAEAFSNVELTFGEDEDSGSIYIKTVGAPTPAITNVDRILKIVVAEPNVHTKNAICCMLGDSGALQKTFGKMVADGWLVSEIRAGKNKKTVNVWSMDANATPFALQP